jgi:hydrogenase maturation protease
MGKFVLGIGNVLLRDEGIGCHVTNALAEIPLPNVKIIDGGTCPDVWQFIEDTDKLVIVDAVKGGGVPGQIYRFHLENISLEPKPLLSVHDLGLVDNLMLMQLWHNIGETVVIGVEPKDIDWGLELSPEIQGEMPHIIDIVLSELNNTNPKGEMKC